MADALRMGLKVPGGQKPGVPEQSPFHQEARCARPGILRFSSGNAFGQERMTVFKQA